VRDHSRIEDLSRACEVLASEMIEDAVRSIRRHGGAARRAAVNRRNQGFLLQRERTSSRGWVT
jgi:hypothetical protein